MSDLPYLARLAAAPAISLLLVLLLGRPMIAWLKRLGAGQRVRDDGPQSHLAKEGTPTMGGVLIVGGAVIAAVSGLIVSGLWYVGVGWFAVMPAMVIVLTLAFAGIGLLDDWLKIARGRSLGLKARQKLGLQMLGAAAFYLTFLWFLRSDLVNLATQVPHWMLSERFALSGGVWVLAVVAASNAVNLADGLDGLAAGLCAIAFLGLAAICLISRMPLESMAIVSLSLAGACLGFLWFNRHPARVFMGDVGSLGLGAGIAALTFLLPHGIWVLIGICFVPLIEEASVIIQVISFKTTGKRIFKMSPIHHHFELMGWSEQRVVYTFWAVGAVAAAVTVWVCLR